MARSTPTLAVESRSSLNEQLAEFYKLYEKEEIRGANTRYCGRCEGRRATAAHDEGADDRHRLHLLRARVGRSLHPRQQARVEDASKHPGLGIKNRFNVPDCPERVHWDEAFALEVGAPGALRLRSGALLVADASGDATGSATRASCAKPSARFAVTIPMATWCSSMVWSAGSSSKAASTWWRSRTTPRRIVVRCRRTARRSLNCRLAETLA